MAVHMDNASDISSRECVQRLYNENLELETKRRKSVQARVPLDPNVWQQMRENFEAIILGDHAFAEKHEIEFQLWQLHYGRIEELRSHYNAAMASSNDSHGQDGKAGSLCPDRVAKIRSQFKTFLSEATGFYHDLMLKIRAKYGFPLGYLSDDPENVAVLLSKDGNKSMELKKGLISCHRCLIYLGDLARYRGIYGEAESKVRDFGAASSYYMQASAFWPSSGNPHHQLAILASYSGDEFVAIYRYFRSLGVENPFLMARDNLIIAFEKNRQSYSQLMGDSRTSATKRGAGRTSGKGRGKAEARLSLNDHKIEASPVKEKMPTLDNLKAFSIKFVRLNGILFTRTSLETFADVLSIVKIGFLKLLSAHTEDQPKFGSDSAESRLFIVRLVAILIFTVHNANRESDDQLYADILQRNVLLQNAYTAMYEIMGHVFERCVELHNLLSSSLLPGILVFIEWLACHPEVAIAGEEEETGVRSFFWNHCISFFNQILSTGLISKDEDECCFFNMSRYDEGETTNQQALWEDFELRGFLPLQPAQKILDFSRKSFSGKNAGYKEKKPRVERIVAAGKAFASVVRVGRQVVYFDRNLKKFTIGIEPQNSCDVAVSNPERTMPNGLGLDMPVGKEISSRVLKPASQLFDGEDDEEEIVFKPPADKHADEGAPMMKSGQILDPVSSIPIHNVGSCVESVLALHDGIRAHNGFFTNAPSPPLSNGAAPHSLPAMPNTSKWLLQQEASVMNGLRNFSLMENGYSMSLKPEEHFPELEPVLLSSPVPQPVNLSASTMQPFITTTHEAVVPPKSQPYLSSASAYGVASINSMQVLPVGAKKNPVLRHNGPPPGFTPPPKPFDGPHHGLSAKDDIPLMDDYSWLDGYEMPSTKPISGSNTSNLAGQAYNNSNVSKTSSMAGMVAFPFPGKQATSQVPLENVKGWQGYQFSQPMKLFQQQPIHKGNQHSMPLPEQYRGQSPWEGGFLV